MPADRPASFAPRGRIRSLFYRGLLSAAHGLFKAGNGCLFTAAGLLRRDELQAASLDQYRKFNVSAVDVDAGLSPGEEHFYGRFLRARERVLLVGCGTGRDLIALQVRGYDVTGLEPVAELVVLAKQHLARRGIVAPLEEGLIETAVLRGPYDAVIFSNGCYSLVQSSAARIAALRRVATHIAPGGRIIVSYHPRARQSRLGRWLTSTAVRLSRSDWQPESGDTFSRDVYVRGLLRYLHAFAPGEFARECEAAGLKMLADEQYSEGYFFAAAERRGPSA
jgi:SAM-dependent methyltransferase